MRFLSLRRAQIQLTKVIEKPKSSETTDTETPPPIFSCQAIRFMVVYSQPAWFPIVHLNVWKNIFAHALTHMRMLSQTVSIHTRGG